MAPATVWPMIWKVRVVANMRATHGTRYLGIDSMRLIPAVRSRTPRNGTHNPRQGMIWLLSWSTGTFVSHAAPRTPAVNMANWAVPNPRRDAPAIIAPAASSATPVTMRAPGSSTAMGGSRLRSGPSMSPSRATQKAHSATTNAARNGVRTARAFLLPDNHMNPAVT